MKVSLKKLREKIIYYCYWYYVKGQPKITDYEYDMLFKELQKREEIEGVTSDSPTQIIYGDRWQQYPKGINYE